MNNLFYFFLNFFFKYSLIKNSCDWLQIELTDGDVHLYSFYTFLLIKIYVLFKLHNFIFFILKFQLSFFETKILKVFVVCTDGNCHGGVHCLVCPDHVHIGLVTDLLTGHHEVLPADHHRNLHRCLLCQRILQCEW